MSVLRWLIAEGLYRDLVTAPVAYLVGHLLAIRPMRELRRLRAEHKRTSDLLDTTKPGGLTDLIEAVRGEAKEQ